MTKLDENPDLIFSYINQKKENKIHESGQLKEDKIEKSNKKFTTKKSTKRKQQFDRKSGRID